MPKIDYSELQTVSTEVKRLRRGIVTQFTAFTAANQTFQGTTDKLTGDSWDSARAYFSPYEEVASSIYNALYDVDDALSNYLNDFVSSVGAAENRLDTDKLEDLRNQLRQEQLRRNEINEALAAAFKDVPFIGNWFQENTMVETASRIAILEKYQAFESAHAGDFSGLCTTMQAVKSGIEFLGSSGNFTGGKEGFKLVDYASTAWYQTLKKVNDAAPKDRYEIVDAPQPGSYIVLKNGVQDTKKTSEYNWLITKRNWNLLKDLGPEVIKIWLNLDDVEVLLDDGSSTLQKSTASIFLLMSVLPADEIEAIIKTAKLIKNGDTTIDTIKLSSASWEALKEAHAASKVIKQVEIAEDVVDAAKVTEAGSKLKFTDVYFEGTTKIGGVEKDISRKVHQLENIDLYRIDEATGLTNLELMKKGRSPIWEDGSKIELHHMLQLEPGPMAELPASLHDEYHSILHGLVENGNSFRNDKDLAKQYNNFRYQYWRWRSK